MIGSLSRSKSLRVMSLHPLVLLVGIVVVLVPPPLAVIVQSFSTPSSTTNKSNILRRKQQHRICALPNMGNVECNIRNDSLHSDVVVGEENGNDSIFDNDIDNLETRRMFVGLCVTTGVASILSANPTSVSAKEEDNEDFIIHDLRAKIENDPSPSELSSSTTVAAAAGATAVDWNAIFNKASKRALGGGKAGASAAAIQVLSLMWLRTSMNRQYRYGGDLTSSLKELWNEGGIPRLYQGLPFALIQGPLTRFGDTAANVGILALLESLPETQSLPLAVKTGLGSITAGLWRIILMPIDSSKTAMQVEGEDGMKQLISLVQEEGPGPLYNGALAQAAATAAGHFPWFLTYNFVDKTLPLVSASDDLLLSLGRAAFLGLCASSVSDITSNSLRVIKTTKQTARLGSVESSVQTTGKGQETISKTKTENGDDVSYREIVQMIIENDGLAGLFGRGLKTRLLTNAIQGALFSVLFKYFQQV